MRKLLPVLLFLISVTASAQRHYGISTSNWSGTNSIYLNPANVADSRHRFTIDLFSINAGMEVDKATFKPSDLINSDSATLVSLLKFKTGTSSFNLTAPFAEVRGPGFMWSIDKKSGVALTTRLRFYNQFQEFDRTLYNTLIDESYRAGTRDIAINSSKFNWNIHAWTEIGLTYGRVLFDNGKHMIKGGITARYLGGISYINMKGNVLTGDYYSQNDSVYIKTSDVTISSNLIKTENQFNNGITGSDIIGDFFNNRSGGGIGIDLGAVYEWRPDNDKFKYDMDGVKGIDDISVNRYKVKASVAITDIGSVRYHKDNETAVMTGSAGFVTDKIKADNFNQFADSVRKYGLNVNIDSNSVTKVKLPTAIQLSIDYNIGRNFYANLLYNGNILNRFVPGNIYYSQLTLTPRYDVATFSVGMPITYNFFSQRLKLGAGLRVGGFFMGSDDMLAFFNSNGQTGANIYLGAYVPFNKKRPKDRDHDGVSNKKDSCISTPGPWENKGCPILDKDGDGILDKDDKCPDLAGSTTAYGCPDRDKDSVADDIDKCPDEPGLVALGGCSDRDHDGVADKDDACPDVAGLPSMQGCPDTDGDGIADNKDDCPDKAGPIANNGCPDTDNDGVPDNKDKCPTVPGTVANNGCPEIREEVKKRLAFAATAIQFETGKAVIKKVSYKILDDIVKILNEYPDYSMRIEGHTDNVGKPSFNLTLSQARAASVKAYFVGKGIAETRLTTNGFGDARPVATNKTTAGRAKNRRVDMNLFLPGDDK